MSNPYLSSGVIDLSEESYIEMKEKLLSNPVTHDHHDKMAPPKKKMPYNPVGQVCPSHLANLTHFQPQKSINSNSSGYGYAPHHQKQIEIDIDIDPAMIPLSHNQ